MKLKVKRYTDAESLSITAKDAFDEEFGCCGMISAFDLFMEFWDGRTFAGMLIGEQYALGELHLDYLVINKRHRNEGYGRQIVDYLKDENNYITLESFLDKEGFYRKCGFYRDKQQVSKERELVDMHYTKRKKRRL